MFWRFGLQFPRRFFAGLPLSLGCVFGMLRFRLSEFLSTGRLFVGPLLVARSFLAHLLVAEGFADHFVLELLVRELVGLQIVRGLVIFRRNRRLHVAWRAVEQDGAAGGLRDEAALDQQGASATLVPAARRFLAAIDQDPLD